ncbi:LysE family transporter [Amycolatopsis sp. EV170708-02-1]|uniref:LysE family transporter n=1 Tax=Amycolatopsis sp. EV170708-02-1 TaxID=2919322 RepID=UPI001F0C13D4|nr:LysE family transporter [Amycolatopsis sp. EV170708-02-1]UMP06937.1 LysE family transporter [Amycolatopsis sp. EV170708-02-1]
MVTTVVLLYFAAASIPGANLALIMNMAASVPRRIAVAAALGIVAATAVLSTAALLGLGEILTTTRWLGELLRIGGAAYLLWVGLAACVRARQPADGQVFPRLRWSAAFRRGLLTNLVNPKTIAFFCVGLAAAVTAVPTVEARLVALVAVVVSSIIWNVSLASILSTRTARSFFERRRRAVGLGSGVVLIALGLQMALT